MEILLVSNRFKEDTGFVAERLASQLAALGARVQIDNGSGPLDASGAQLIVVLGGDGTILRAARTYGHLGIPILGVNMGTIGFLSSIEIHDLEEHLPCLLEGDFKLDERMMLQVEVREKGKVLQQSYCLNEMVIHAQLPRMAAFQLKVSGQPLGFYRGDGLIIATPTGSTAYSLSAGGPVVDPGLEALIVTPVASHAVNRRPLVVSAREELCIIPLAGQDVHACLDGQVRFEVNLDTELIVRPAGHRLQLVSFKAGSFFSELEERLKRLEEWADGQGEI